MTEREKDAIMTYLKDHKKTGIIRTLLYRSRRYILELKEEMLLVEELIEDASN